MPRSLTGPCSVTNFVPNFGICDKPTRFKSANTVSRWNESEGPTQKTVKREGRDYQTSDAVRIHVIKKK